MHSLGRRIIEYVSAQARGLRSTIFDFDPAHAGFSHFRVTTLSRCSQHGVIWGRLGSNGVEIGGRVPPPPKSAGKFGRKLTKSFCLLAGAMAHRFLGVEKTHKIEAKMVPNGVIVRRKMKRFIPLSECSSNRAMQFFQILTLRLAPFA